MVEQRTKRLIGIVIAVVLLAVAILPFFSAPTVLSATPPGYSELDSTTVVMPFERVQSTAYLNGSPAGFSDFAIDHDQFPFDVTLGNQAVTIVDAYQTETANYIVVEVDRVEGSIIISEGVSQGVEVTAGSIYATNAMYPNRTGGYRTVAGEYFYGLEQVTLVLAARLSFSLTDPIVNVGGVGVSPMTMIGFTVFVGGVVFVKKRT